MCALHIHSSDFPPSGIKAHLGSGVDGGPCLKEYPHHTGVTMVGCYHQSSYSILWREVERYQHMNTLTIVVLILLSLPW